MFPSDAVMEDGWGLPNASQKNLSPVTYKGKVIQPPSAEEFRRLNSQEKHDFLDGIVGTRAFNQGNIRVVRDGNVVTLYGKAIVYASDGYEQFAADSLARWNNISVKESDGMTYRKNITFAQTNKLSDSNVWLRYADWANGNGGWSNPGGNGETTFGTNVLAALRAGSPFAAGDAAHEFGHDFFGLKDAYRRVVAPSGWYADSIPYVGFENSLMANPRTGVILPADLKALINHFEGRQAQQQLKRGVK